MVQAPRSEGRRMNLIKVGDLPSNIKQKLGYLSEIFLKLHHSSRELLDTNHTIHHGLLLDRDDGKIKSASGDVSGTMVPWTGFARRAIMTPCWRDFGLSELLAHDGLKTMIPALVGL